MLHHSQRLLFATSQWNFWNDIKGLRAVAHEPCSNGMAFLLKYFHLGYSRSTKHLLGHVDNSAYPAINADVEVDLTLPNNVSGSVPVVLESTFERYPRRADATPSAPAPPEQHPTWKEQVLAKGWGYALLYPTTIQADKVRA